MIAGNRVLLWLPVIAAWQLSFMLISEKLWKRGVALSDDPLHVSLLILFMVVAPTITLIVLENWLQPEPPLPPPNQLRSKMLSVQSGRKQQNKD